MSPLPSRLRLARRRSGRVALWPLLLLVTALPCRSAETPPAGRFPVKSEAAGGSVRPGELRTLTTVAELRQLSPEEAQRGYPVRLRGVVTYRAPGLPFQFIQDETGGTYVSSPAAPEESRGVVEPGNLVEVDGVSTAGRFAPFLGEGEKLGTTWRVIGRVPLPAARRVSIGELADPQFHSEYIELSGVVRQVRHRWLDRVASDSVWIKIGTATASFSAQFFDPLGVSRLPAQFIGSRVTVRGVYGSTFNERRQLVGFRLLVDPDLGIEVEQLGPRDPFVDLPDKPISAVMQFQGETRETPMVRISGTVTQVRPGRGLYLEAGDHGIWVESEEHLSSFGPGQRVTVVGFPAFGSWSPMLKDSLVRGLGPGELPAAPLVSALEARSGRYDCRRVTLDGTLLEISNQGDSATAVLQHEGATFVAEWMSPDAATALRQVAPGSQVRVTGICVNKRLDTSIHYESAAFTALVTPGQVGVRLMVAAVEDLTVVRAPDWWTTERIWIALGIVVATVGSILAWNFSLRRRVAMQTEIIRTQASREAVHEDRTRIARELHDTLEQELTGIAVQLDAVNDRLPESPPAAAKALSTARALLRHTRTEARRSVWDLRAALLEEGDLGSALRETARHFGSVPGIAVSVAGEPRRLPAAIENNLFRIGTEAMTNALKHARARSIAVRLTYEPTSIRLEINDDGQGFDASRSTNLAAGHFGLLGIRERAERIGAVLTVDSAEGAGTRLTVLVQGLSGPVMNSAGLGNFPADSLRHPRSVG